MLQNFKAPQQAEIWMKSNHIAETSEFSSAALQLMMEFPSLSFPILFTFLLFLFMVLKIVSKTKTSSTPKLPPGPWKLPIIGNIHQFVGSLPHRCLRDLAMKHGPLMYLRLGQVSIAVISSVEIAKEVMKTHDIIFASRPFNLALLSAKRVQSFRPIREEETTNFIKSISMHSGSLMNLSEKLSSLTCGIIAKAAIGSTVHGQEEFIALIKETIEKTGGFNVADLFPSIKMLAWISGLKPRLEKMH
ncbi:cytochrome P450 71D9-like [Cornus florida]|uniref:cytochrome P450 71D9-like n=1 Tax=Cornus florida TaxID=4283 RepID=UPI002897AD74|nr:cytochrome P450 71D9-like [Cornus florida]